MGFLLVAVAGDCYCYVFDGVGSWIMFLGIFQDGLLDSRWVFVGEG